MTIESPIKMTQLELRSECKRIFDCETIDIAIETLDIYIQLMSNIILNHHLESHSSETDGDAKIIFQMILLKAHNLKKIAYGVQLSANPTSKSNPVIDPTIIAILFRNLYETVGLFNLIYRISKSEDEKNVSYWLWKISGLKYRQRFSEYANSVENKKTCERDQQDIVNLTDKVKSSDLYKSLDPLNQDKILNGIKAKKYLLSFEDKKVKFLSWQSLSYKMELKEHISKDIYNYLSLHTHPSHISVSNFAEIFEEKDFLWISKFQLKYTFILMSIFISDYIQLFPNVLQTFNNISERDQIVIDFYHSLGRGELSHINNAYLALG